MINYAGYNDKDTEIANELKEAGITAAYLPEAERKNQGEVQTVTYGFLYGWTFRRAWYYWVATAKDGSAIPYEIAIRINDKIGRELRVDGYSGGKIPDRYGVGSYHIDSQEALNVLADTIKKIQLTVIEKNIAGKERYIYDDRGKVKDEIEVVNILKKFGVYEFVLLRNGSVGLINLLTSEFISDEYSFYMVRIR